MPLLRTLGAVELLEPAPDGGRHIEVQQKRLALLVFLRHRGRSPLIRRDELLALFWPEMDVQHGRGVLRQALAAFRRQLGPDSLVTRGEDEVGLAPGFLASDAEAFEEAFRSGRHEQACALYRGHFLEAFHATGVAPEFEHWVDAERERLRRLAGDAAARRAAQSADAGDIGDAIRWARHAVELEPGNEKGVARLISLLDQHGDRAGALDVYRALERRLAEEFAAQPSPDTRALMQAIRRRATPHSLPLPDPEAVFPSNGSASPPVRAQGPAAMHSRRPLLLAGALGGLVAIALALVIGPARPTRAPPDRLGDVVAVAPFRVHANGELAWLEEGMVELLAMRLSGTEPVAIVEPGRLLAHWHRVASELPQATADTVLYRVAEAVGANRVIRGSVSGLPQHLTLSAWVIAMPDGRTETQAAVEGPADSLSSLVDRLGVKLLGLTTGMEAHRLGSLDGVPLPAIQAFLAGRAALRRGRPEDAAVRFREAIGHDSTFALAGLELRRAAAWTKRQDDIDLGARVTRVHRAGLSAPDRALLDAMQSQWRDAPTMFRTWNAAVVAYPERPETWYGLADSYLHWGMLAGIDSALALAEGAFRHGWELDSAANGEAALTGPLIAETMDHLVGLAHLRGDTAEVLRLTSLVLSVDSSSHLASKLRWHRAAMQGPAARRAFWERTMVADQPLMKVVLFTLWTHPGADDHAMAARENRRRFEIHDPGYRSFALFFEAWNAGRPDDAPPARDVELGLRTLLAGAISWGGDATAANEAALQLERFVARPQARSGGAPVQYWNLCRLGLWRAHGGDIAGANAYARRLREGRPPGLGQRDSAQFDHYRELCSSLLDATGAVTLHRIDARAQVGIADSLARTYIFEVCCGEAVTDANLILARLWERLGDRPNALRAVRRRSGGFLLGPLYISTFLREEGRLAALTGDTTGAIQAYRHFLALQPNPQPPAAIEKRGVEIALSSLVRRSR